MNAEKQEHHLADRISLEVNDFGRASLALIKRLNAQKKAGVFFPTLMAALLAASLVGAVIIMLPTVQRELELPAILPQSSQTPSLYLLHQHSLELRCTQLADGTLEVVIAGRKPVNVQSSGIGIRGLFGSPSKEED